MLTRPNHPITAVLIALAIGAAACAPVAGTPAAAPATEQQMITVTGDGQAHTAPDMATVSVGVQVVNTEISAAIDQSNQTIGKITDAIKALGVADADVHTTNFSVWPEDRYDPNSGQLLPDRNYRVESTIEINVRAIDKVGQVLEAAIQNGANNIYGLNFQLQDTSGLASQARAAAIDDAQARAQEVASALGVSLGEVVSATEVSGGTIFPVFEGGGLGGGGGAPPISQGEMTITVSMQVSYRIER